MVFLIAPRLDQPDFFPSSSVILQSTEDIWNCLTVSCGGLLLCGISTKDCNSCQTGPPHFPLASSADMSTVLLLVGLGIGDRVGLRELSILHRANCFVLRAKWEVAPFKRITLRELQRETDIHLPLLLSASSRKVFSLSCRLQKCRQRAGICSEIRR